ncbi:MULTISPECIES: SigF/SigG family RNA polymerase sporulation sigma factor [unclassified Candidatus Frackibacter]|uniref:SigF/SigG family RNA polymerase sporulation sigma factor n=1 Tax=unclassified Candidatus Frackibacter TaxID=2648818 RepID=UPI00079BA502|nr:MULTISPECIES: SigF/SigG family RNA polymerase sporulation sigma factor [unclassified Candidatus Frackibacter]KXS43669.1 MAG: RNA polymerase sporulation-specific sigma factor [Candidatus Frackibacter sp. T328-2]SDC01882.1 RNA polymerase, sigma subunit, RpoX/SigF [Candidatus Frackibacter sp. WG11]SEM33064.1 RNA polymerase, sigma subunit, RpoX/SigF [Candidatus Frackibacter sp. WG12]SFL38071.1 RNA polymerase, sigma subunit, RpoX/SigF [Candidatus Frackibacter sp. WG13]
MKKFGNGNLNIPEKELLSDEETKELLAKAQAGSNEAKEKLVNHNLKLILKIAHRFANSNYNYEELFQIGSIGLLKAIERFDLDRGVKFSTYAVPLIIGEIKRFLRDDDVVKVSRSLKNRAYKINKVKEELMAELNREPTVGEVADKLDVSKEEVVTALEAVQEPTSLYTSIYEEEGSSIELIDQLAATSEEYEKEIDRLDLQQVIQYLEPREKLILKLRYFDELTQNEIAEQIGVSQVQVSRLERKIIKKIREEIN